MFVVHPLIKKPWAFEPDLACASALKCLCSFTVTDRIPEVDEDESASPSPELKRRAAANTPDVALIQKKNEVIQLNFLFDVK